MTGRSPPAPSGRASTTASTTSVGLSSPARQRARAAPTARFDACRSEPCDRRDQPRVGEHDVGAWDLAARVVHGRTILPPDHLRSRRLTNLRVVRRWRRRTGIEPAWPRCSATTVLRTAPITRRGTPPPTTLASLITALSSAVHPREAPLRRAPIARSDGGRVRCRRGGSRRRRVAGTTGACWVAPGRSPTDAARARREVGACSMLSATTRPSAGSSPPATLSRTVSRRSSTTPDTGSSRPQRVVPARLALPRWSPSPPARSARSPIESRRCSRGGADDAPPGRTWSWSAGTRSVDPDRTRAGRGRAHPTGGCALVTRTACRWSDLRWACDPRPAMAPSARAVPAARVVDQPPTTVATHVRDLLSGGASPSVIGFGLHGPPALKRAPCVGGVRPRRRRCIPGPSTARAVASPIPLRPGGSRRNRAWVRAAPYAPAALQTSELRLADALTSAACSRVGQTIPVR